MNYKKNSRGFYSQFGYFNADEIKEVKLGLVSRNEQDILAAVEIVMNSMDNDEFAQHNMTTDLPILLSEAVLPGYRESNALIYLCLRKMCNYRKFFTDGHSAIVSLSACRSGAFLINQPEEKNELDLVLQLLAHVLCGYKLFQLMPDKRLLLQLNDLLAALSLKKVDSAETLIHIAALLNELLEVRENKFREADLRIALDSLLRCFESLTQTLSISTYETKVDSLINISCCLAVHICRFLNPIDESKVLLSTDAKISASRLVTDFVIKTAVPYVMAVPLSDFEQDPDGVVSLFKCISHLLAGSEEESKRLANELVASKMLSLIPTVLYHAGVWHNENLRKLTVQLILQILTLLCLDVLNFPETMLEGEDNILKELEVGVMGLPDDPYQWLLALVEPRTHRSVKLVILLYIYFEVLVDGRLKEMNTYVAVTQFIKELNASGARTVIVKVVWLIFALLHNEVSLDVEDFGDEVILKMSTLLEGHGDLSNVYTHHPVLLFNAFFSKWFPTGLQEKVMRQWLIHREAEEDVQFSKLLRTCDAARFTALNLVESGDCLVLDKAFTAYKDVMIEEERDEEADAVWRRLPTVLSHVCAGAISRECFEKITELSLIRLPESRDPHDQSRAAILLPAAVSALDEPPLCVWKLAHRLLTFHIEKSDFQIVTCYIQSEPFMRKLLDNMSSPCPAKAQYCLKIAACLSTAQRREDLPPVNVNIDLDIVPVMYQLVSSDRRLRHAALLFVHEVLECKWSPPICTLGESPTVNTLRLCFFLLKNVCILDKNEECWECLKSILLLCPRQEPITIHFIQSHWLFYLIENCLPSLGESAAMLDFVETWYTMRRPRPFSSHSLSAPIEISTITLLAEEILRSFQPSMLPLLIKVYEGGEIPDASLLSALGNLATNRVSCQVQDSAGVPMVQPTQLNQSDVKCKINNTEANQQHTIDIDDCDPQHSTIQFINISNTNLFVESTIQTGDIIRATDLFQEPKVSNTKKIPNNFNDKFVSQRAEGNLNSPLFPKIVPEKKLKQSRSKHRKNFVLQSIEDRLVMDATFHNSNIDSNPQVVVNEVRDLGTHQSSELIDKPTSGSSVKIDNDLQTINSISNQGNRPVTKKVPKGKIKNNALHQPNISKAPKQKSKRQKNSVLKCTEARPEVSKTIKMVNKILLEQKIAAATSGNLSDTIKKSSKLNWEKDTENHLVDQNCKVSEEISIQRNQRMANTPEKKLPKNVSALPTLGKSICQKSSALKAIENKNGRNHSEQSIWYDSNKKSIVNDIVLQKSADLFGEAEMQYPIAKPNGYMKAQSKVLTHTTPTRTEKKNLRRTAYRLTTQRKRETAGLESVDSTLKNDLNGLTEKSLGYVSDVYNTQISSKSDLILTRDEGRPSNLPGSLTSSSYENRNSHDKDGDETKLRNRPNCEELFDRLFRLT